MFAPISARFEERVVNEPDFDLLLILKDLGREFGIDHFTYFAKTLGAREPRNVIATTYSGGWLHRYQEADYHLVDPVIRLGLSSLLPLDWSMIPKSGLTVRNFFGEAAEFGVLPRGLSVPIRDAAGGRALFSINTDMSKKGWQDFRRAFVSDITYLGFLFHHHYGLRQADDALSVRRPVLSAREIEVLHWAAAGKTAWETSQILDLAERTIAFYLSNACAKLGVVNKTQAVALAVSHGLIVP